MFENWPFTNFHDLNLDWIISRVKHVEDSEASAQSNAETATLAANKAGLSEEAAAHSAADASISAFNAKAAETNITAAHAQIQNNTDRINNLVANAGDVSQNAELLDIRVAYDNKTYNTAGAAVRGQATMLHDDVAARSTGIYTVPSNAVISGTYDHQGNVVTQPERIAINGWIHVYEGDSITFIGGSLIDRAAFVVHDADFTFLEERYWLTNKTYVFDREYQIHMSFKKSADGPINPSNWDATVYINRQEWAPTIHSYDAFYNGYNIMPEVLYSGTYIDSDGVEKPATSWDRTAPVEVIEGKTYYVYDFHEYSKKPNNMHVTEYDKYMNFLNHTSLLNGLNSFTPTRATRYVVFSGDPMALKYSYLTNKNTMPDCYIKPGYENNLYNRTEWCYTSWAKMGVNYLNTYTDEPKYPHGSKVSFKAAAYEGYTAVLIDLIKTSDGEWVVSHENNLYTLATNDNGSPIGSPWNITQHTLAEVKALDMGYKTGYPGTRILTVEEALKYLKALGMQVVIECEIGGSASEWRALMDRVATYGMDDKLIIFSYYKSELAYVSNIMPNAKLMLYAGSTAAEVESHIEDLKDLKTPNNTCILNTFARVNTPVNSTTHLKALIDNNIELSGSTPDHEPGDFINYVNTPQGQYTSYFGTVRFPAFKMMLDNA